jgi:hypothetical protein
MGGNQTAGLFGGLMIGVAILAAVWYVQNGFSLTPASSSTTTAATPPTASGGSSSSSTAVPALTTQPYQLVSNSGNGISISTAAEIAPNEAPMITLPQLAPLAPTSPTLYYA